MNSRDESLRRDGEHSTFDGVYFSVRYLLQQTNEVLCLLAEDAQGNIIGTWPQPERSLAELD